ncbi:MAG: outer membrane protein assembly factor BamA [Moraxella sp.]|nr:outer membrane protein assembly factor BamA [Moraxella sp.]
MIKPSFGTRTITAAILMAMTAPAFAASFVVSEIDFVGLSRVTPESAAASLPVSVGEVMTDESLADSIRALYETSQFSNVQADVVGNRVVYHVSERPIIAELNFEGNKLIPKDGLTDGLKSAGLSVGAVLKQATVHAIETELENQYISQGYYNSSIEVMQTELPSNRVKLDIKFIEGKPAKVVDINILGNEYFSDNDIKDEFALKETSWNFLSKSDRYAQEKLAASLENVRALYLNDGFVRFNVDNTTVNLNDDKQSVFVEMTVSEGVQYQFGKTQFLGKPTYDASALSELKAYADNSKFSQAKLDETTQAIAGKFGNEGYFNAQIRPVTRIDDETRTVDVDYYIDPVRPVYVRRINFSGNIKTKDEVLRREMRQLEGALASNQKIQLSRVRLMRTGFFKNVVVETKPVPNSPDQMDVNFIVEEQPSGSSTLAAGYSQSGGITFQVDLSQSNFMGTGNRVNAAFTRSETRENYSLGLTDPYFTENGVSQSISAYYRKTKYDSKNISNYVMDSLGASLSYGYPIDEKQRVSAGMNIDNTKVRGGRFMGISNVKQLMDDGGTAEFFAEGSTTIPSFKNNYTTYNGLLGWSYSDLDRPVFPTSGMSHNVDLTLGFGDATYQKVVYRGNYYQPLWKGSILRGWAKLGYGNDLPFYENFYAGGYGSVRGFKASSLGPLSQAYMVARTGGAYARGEEVGGNALATFGAELILPMPFKGDWADQVRPVLFFDAGQVFDTTGMDKEYIDLTSYGDSAANATNYKLLEQDKEFRYSAGIGVTWYTPIGPLSISYAQPINSKDGDQTEKVQFQIGSVF